jgi:hypothetical protein
MRRTGKGFSLPVFILLDSRRIDKTASTQYRSLRRRAHTWKGENGVQSGAASPNFGVRSDRQEMFGSG